MVEALTIRNEDEKYDLDFSNSKEIEKLSVLWRKGMDKIEEFEVLTGNDLYIYMKSVKLSAEVAKVLREFLPKQTNFEDQLAMELGL